LAEGVAAGVDGAGVGIVDGVGEPPAAGLSVAAGAIVGAVRYKL
jgi:hypothetical protein